GVVALCAGTQTKAQTWSENFNSGTIPTGWILRNVDGKTPKAIHSYINDAWVVTDKKDAAGNVIAGDKVIISTSDYTPAGTANDWIITKSFTVTAGMALQWDEKALEPTAADGYQVLVSTATDANADFTNVLYTTSAANTDKYITKFASLNAFAGQTIYVAFRNNSNDKYLLTLDNVSAFMPAANDIYLVSTTPNPGDQKTYGVSGNNLLVTGKVTNAGSTPITSYSVKAKVGNGAVVTNTFTAVNIAPFATASFTSTVPVVFPATLGANNVKIWAEVTGDTNPLNDSSATIITSAAFLPKKKLFVEEATGTWCGWCPRGAVYMDSLYNNHRDDVSLVAVHNGDPMVLSAYDNFMGTLIQGYPSAIVDRGTVLDPSELIDAYNAHKGDFGFADITLTDVAEQGFTYSVKASVKPAVDMSGDYRLGLVLTENDVTGKDGKTSTSKYTQTNYYSHSSQDIPLEGAGHDWQAEKAKVADSMMEYEFVARNLVPSADGEANSLPTTMTANTSYDHTFTTTIRADRNRPNMNAIVFLIRMSDGAVLNSQNVTVPLGVSNVKAGVEGLTIFPNPASNNVNINFSLIENTKVAVQVIDAAGRIVSSLPMQSMNSGNNHLSIATDQLPAGVYSVRLQTEKGIMVKQLAIIK
ncbi:MAG: Omp28-related outer membrane protein, partial [Sphingobacteriales bacterium]